MYIAKENENLEKIRRFQLKAQNLYSKEMKEKQEKKIQLITTRATSSERPRAPRFYNSDSKASSLTSTSVSSPLPNFLRTRKIDAESS